MSRGPIPYEQFAPHWNAAPTLDDAAKALGITPRQAIQRAAHYRRSGRPLKRFSHGRPRRGAATGTEYHEFTLRLPRPLVPVLDAIAGLSGQTRQAMLEQEIAAVVERRRPELAAAGGVAAGEKKTAKR